MAAIRHLPFDAWIEHAFGPAVPLHGNPWFLDPENLDTDYWDPDPRLGVAYLTRLFAEGPQHLRWFSDAQIAQGLTYLVDTSAVGAQPYVADPTVPAKARSALWDAVALFFRDVLMPRCEPALGHLNETWNPINLVTYMWWEGFPATFHPGDPKRGAVVEAEIRALSEILELSSPACQEAALHGIGHYTRYDWARARCERLIDAYLERGEASRPELIAYARAARTGCIL